MQESAENYLETILILGQSGKSVRSVDLAHALDYSRPSVSIAMKNLRMNGYILVDSDGYITLTDSGRKVAETMYERHVLISDWLIFLGVDREVAVNDACKMEHVMSQQSFAAIKARVEKWKLEIYRQKEG